MIVVAASGLARWSEPFQYGFVRNALAVAVLAGVLCGLMGTFVVLRGMSYIGHGLSHAIFGGAAVAALLSVNFFAGAGLWGVASGLTIGRVARRRKVAVDAAIGVVTIAGFALGIVIMNANPRAGRGKEALLFGSILGVSLADVAIIAGVTLAAALVVFFGYRRLLYTSFDGEVAEVSGVRTAWVEALLLVLLSAVVVVTIKVLGATLVAAILVVPPATARLLTNSFSRMLGLAMLLGAATGLVGMYASYFLDVSSGATIVLVQAACFAAAFVVRGRSARRLPAGALHLH